MNYTPFVLAVLGLSGVFIHNLLKLGSLNKNNPGTITLKKYLSLEIYNILACLIFILIGAFILDGELHLYLEEKGFLPYFGFMFFLFGFFSQYILSMISNKGQKYMDDLVNEKKE